MQRVTTREMSLLNTELKIHERENVLTIQYKKPTLHNFSYTT